MAIGLMTLELIYRLTIPPEPDLPEPLPEPDLTEPHLPEPLTEPDPE